MRVLTMAKKMTKLMAQRINASLMHDAVFIDRPKCGVTSASWLAACASARDAGVALYERVIRRAQYIDPAFDAPVGTFDSPLIQTVNR